MLRNKEATATIPVKDLKVAKKFYETVLGLESAATDDESLTYKSGSCKIMVYRSQYAGTNQATALSFTLGDELERIVAALKERGVAFEHYDLPGLTRKGDLHVGGELKAAWFKDPDGNILALVNQ